MIDPLDYLRGEVAEDLAKDKTYQGIVTYGMSQKLQAEAQNLADIMGVRVESVTNGILETIEKKRPEIVLFEESDETLALATRLAQRLRLGLITGCVRLEIDYNKRLLLIHRPIYGGRMMEVCVCKTKPQIAMMKGT